MKKKDIKKFNTYDARIKKVRELSASSCKQVYVKICDCQHLLYACKVFRDPKVREMVKTLKLDLEEYIDNLQTDKVIDLESINIVNKGIDKRVAEVKDYVENVDSTLANELANDVCSRIRKTGYIYLFDERKMKSLLKEKNNVRKIMYSQKQINQGKAVSAMFSKLYSTEERMELIEALKLSEQQG